MVTKNMQMLVEKANSAVLDVRVDDGDEKAAEEESVDDAEEDWDDEIIEDALPKDQDEQAANKWVDKILHEIWSWRRQIVDSWLVTPI